MLRITQLLPPLCLLTFFLTLIACSSAPKSTIDYAPVLTPDPPVPMALTTGEDPGTVWARLQQRLRRSFFQVVEKDATARTVRLSAVTTTPADFCSGGTVNRTYEQGDDKQLFTFPFVSASEFLEARGPASPSGHLVADIDRTTQLSILADLALEPAPGGGTRITVNINYSLNVKAQGDLVTLDSDFSETSRRALDPAESSLTFSTSKAGQARIDGLDVTVATNGKLERQVLNLTQSNP